LENLQAWEGESLGPKLRPKAEAVVAAVNAMDVYFWSGLEKLLRLTENGEIRFGDIVGWEKGEQDAETLKICQQEELEYCLMLCWFIPEQEKQTN
jgi:hypothetical protein